MKELAQQEWHIGSSRDCNYPMLDADNHIICHVVGCSEETATAIAALPKLVAACLKAQKAIYFTREYVGEVMLPEIEGWEWFDAMKQLQAALEAVNGNGEK